MLSKYYSIYSYPAFDGLIRKFEQWLESETINVLGYKSIQVKKRLAQRIVELGLVPFIQASASAYQSQQIGSENHLNSFGGFHVNLISGKISIRCPLFIHAIAEFHLHWTHIFLNILRAMLLRKQLVGPATLVFGVGIESLFVGNSDSRFVAYCKQGPVQPLKDATRLIVQADGANQSNASAFVQYARFPLFLLLKNLGICHLVELVFKHLVVYFVYWFSIFKKPILNVIGRDFAYHPLVSLLNRRQLIESVVITNSNYSAQPLWMSSLPNRCFKTHMVWYAQNTIPIIYRDNPHQVYLPNYRHLMVDTSWVWTRGYAEYLRSLNPALEIRDVGPIVWNLPEIRDELANQELIVTIFDVTPVNDDFAMELGLFGNYYSGENMINFIDQTMRVISKIQHKVGREIRILLKHKRGHHSRHSQEYIARINQYVESSRIEIVPFNENIYKVIAQSTMVVVVPYSSPAYIADTLNVPAIFFDPTGSVYPIYEHSKNLRFISSDTELEEAILEILNASDKRACQ